MSNDNTTPNDDALGKLYEQYSKIEDERAAKNAEAKAAMERLIDDPSWLTEDLLTRDLPEISPETEAAFLAAVEADLEETFGPKRS